MMAFFLAAMMFSLAGVPPLAGFFAKFYVFAAAIKAGLYGLAVIGVLASAVGAYYYLRIVKLMYFDEPAKAFDRPGLIQRSVLAVAAILILAFVFAPSLLTNAAMAAAQTLFYSGRHAGGRASEWRVDRLERSTPPTRRRGAARSPGTRAFMDRSRGAERRPRRAGPKLGVARKATSTRARS